MGVDYRAVLALGKEFDYQSEVVDFLRETIGLSDEDEEYIDSDGVTEWAYGRDDGLTVDCLNCYSGDYYYLGFDLSPRDVERFAEQVQDAQQSWDKLFPDHAAELIHTVKIY